jgi:hypothetical protein
MNNLLRFIAPATYAFLAAVAFPASAAPNLSTLDQVKASALCAPTERVMFTCMVSGARAASVCLTTDTKAPRLRLLVGAKGNSAQVDVPAYTGTVSPETFSFWEYQSSQGGWIRLRVRQAQGDYVVYQNWHVSDMPVQSAGVATLMTGKPRELIACTSNTYTNPDFRHLDKSPAHATAMLTPDELSWLRLPAVSWKRCMAMSSRDRKRYCSGSF